MRNAGTLMLEETRLMLDLTGGYGSATGLRAILRHAEARNGLIFHGSNFLYSTSRQIIAQCRRATGLCLTVDMLLFARRISTLL